MKKNLLFLSAQLFCSFCFCQNPVMLRDIATGNNAGTIAQIVKTNNYIFFNEDDDDPDGEKSLFRTDGTSAGTIKLNLTYPGFTGLKAEKMVALGNKVVFGGTNTANYGEIWVSDGTQDGTIGLEKFQPTTLNAPPIIELASMGGYVYYSVVNSNNHAIIKRTDGTVAGTSLVYDFTGFSGIPSVILLNPINGILYFDVWDVGGSGSDQLWRSDGTPAGTYLLKNFGSGVLSSSFMPGGNLFYFIAGAPTGTANVYTNSLWKSDGTVSGTVLLKDLNNGVSGTNGFPQYAAIGNTFYFGGFTDANGRELWKSDGTTLGTVMVSDINPGTANSNPVSLTVLNNVLYFRANTPTYGAELWKYDGVSAPSLVKDINPGTAASGATNFTVSNNTILFNANNGTNGAELWITDGTSANTFMVADINPGAGNSSPNTFTIGNPVYFAATDGVNGFEVYKYDNNLLTGVIDIFNNSDLKLFPNPAKNQLSIVSDTEFSRFTIINSAGQILMEGTGRNKTINISSLHPGIYYLRLNKGGITETKMFKKE